MEHSAEQLEGAIEMGGRIAVNRDEKLVADWLCTQGHAVRHLTNGEDPPDLVVDGNIAVEVTTIASYADRTNWDFMAGLCKSLGRAEHGRGYLLGVRFDNERLLQDGDRGKVKAIEHELRFDAKSALRNHYRNPDGRILGPIGEPPDFLPRDGLIRLRHGVELRIIAPIQDNQNNVKYEVFWQWREAVWVVPHLIETIQAAISKKTNKPTIRERAVRYPEWWLVLTDPNYSQGVAANEAREIADAIRYGEPWRRILLANTWGDRVEAVHCLTGTDS